MSKIKLVPIYYGFGGLNTFLSEDALPNISATDILNADFRSVFALSKRRGRNYYNSSEITSSAGIYGLHKSYSGTTKFLCVSRKSGSADYDDIYSGSGGNWTSRYTLSSKNNMTDFTDFMGQCYICNGVDIGLKTSDGTNFYPWSMVAPADTPAETHAGAGTLDATEGGYKYALRFGNSVTGWWSNFSPQSTVTGDFTDKTVAVTNLEVSTDGQVNTKELWRTADGGAVLFRVTSLATAATTYDDQTTDANLGTVEYETNHNVVPLITFATEVNGHILGAGIVGDLSSLVYSKKNEPESFPTLYQRYIARDSGDDITGIAKLHGTAYIFTQNSIYELSMDGEHTTWRATKKTSIGCIATKTIADGVVMGAQGVPLDVIFFLSRGGVYAWDGFTAHLISKDIEPTFVGTDTKIVRMNSSQTYRKLAVGVYHNHKYRLSFADENSNTNNVTITIDVMREKEKGQLVDWSVYNHGASCYIVFEGAGDNYELYSGHPTAGYVTQEETGWDDLDANLDLMFQTKNHDMVPGHPELDGTCT